jgi:hypothetical protein
MVLGEGTGSMNRLSMRCKTYCFVTLLREKMNGEKAKTVSNLQSAQDE